MFSNCKTTTEQGDIGEARAIYEYVKLGYIVSKPINDKAKYDLIIDKDGVLQRVQVKTSSNHVKENNNIYKIKISSDYANRNVSIRKPRNELDYDILFVLVESGEVWSIPVEHLGDVKTQINVGGTKYQEYKL